MFSIVFLKVSFKSSTRSSSSIRDFIFFATFVISFVRHIIETYKVDKSKIYLCGTSMGAYGTWATAHEFPDMFKGIAPVSGGVYEISQYQAHRFKNLAVWAFHNKGDEIIRCEDSVVMINSINKEGGSAKIKSTEHSGREFINSTQSPTKIRSVGRLLAIRCKGLLILLPH